MSDLNVDNYSVQDMHNILKLTDPSTQQIIEKADMLIQKMKNKGKPDMGRFLEDIKNKLTAEESDDSEEEEDEEITEISNIIKSKKPHKKRTSQILNIDSRFRSNYYDTLSTSFTAELPETQTDITGMYVSSVEMPHSFFSISNKLGNNKMLIWQPKRETYVNAWIISLQDSNYDITWFEDTSIVADTISMINLAINNPNTTVYGCMDTTTNMFVPLVDSDVNPYETGLVPGLLFSLGNTKILSNIDSSNSYVDLNQTSHTKGAHLWNLTNYDTYIFFNIDGPFTYNDTENYYKIDSTKNIQLTLAWSLGFRAASYKIPANDTRLLSMDQLQLKVFNVDQNISIDLLSAAYNFHFPSIDSAIFSESLAFLSAPRYAFICIDDFQNNSATPYVQCYNDWATSRNIVARINIAQNYQGLFSTMMLRREKKYHGPVNIKKLKIDVVDEYGRIIDLNYQDWSFTIEFLKDKNNST